MGQNKVICNTNNVDYMSIRKAMVMGARTESDLKEMVNVCAECDGCKENLEYILTTICGCKNVKLVDVENAIKNGAKTAEEVGVITGAGTECTRCRMLIEKML